jgi:RNAse (barnase) inhibitor barstar
VASFRDDPEEWQRLDWRLMQNGPVALYFQAAVLEEDLAWLASRDYAIDEFDCGTWDSLEIMHSDLAGGLGFPDYYGRNPDALNDCLGDIAVPDNGGRALVFRNFESFAGHQRDTADVLLDIVARVAWRKLMVGGRLLGLVQSGDPRLELAAVGSHSVLWNPREWLNSKRGL